MANVDFAGQYKRIMRFFWDPEPKNDDATMASIWCLGVKYAARPSNGEERRQVPHTKPEQWRSCEHILDNETVMIANRYPEAIEDKNAATSGEVMVVPPHTLAEEDQQWPPAFLDDFESRLWFTYRSHFPPIARSSDPVATSSLSLAVRLRSQIVEQSGFTSDTGWGCMIRSGQCLIANSLQVLRFGRNWRRHVKSQAERELLSLFADDPRAPFSIHKFVEHGAAACEKHPGEWFGPSATARCIQALSRAYNDCGIGVYITGDGADVYQDAVFRVAKQADHSFKPVLVLVGIRLGIDRVNPVYWEGLKITLQLPQSIGIAGGRPSASHYFVGMQGDHFFFLDPHQTRPMLAFHESPDMYSDEEVNSCHTRRLRRIHIESMDPSMLIGFLIRDENDWHSWRDSLNNVQGKPVLHIADAEPSLHGHGTERSSALDEVETFDDEDD